MFSCFFFQLIFFFKGLVAECHSFWLLIFQLRHTMCNINLNRWGPLFLVIKTLHPYRYSAQNMEGTGSSRAFYLLRVQDQGTQHEGDVVHGQEHDGVRGAGGRDHRHPPHNTVQCKEGRQLLYSAQGEFFIFFPVLRIRIRIHRIHMFLGLLDPDPLVRGLDLRIWILLSSCKNSKKNLIPTILWLFLTFYLWKKMYCKCTLKKK